MSHLYVIKRSGKREEVHFDKITARNKALCYDLPKVDPVVLTMKVIEGIHAGIKTSELDVLSAETALFMSAHEPSYEILAKRLAISGLHKSTVESFWEVTQKLRKLDLLNHTYWDFVSKHHDYLETLPQHERDYDYTFFGYKTLEKSYLTRDANGTLLERPQHLLLRIAVFVRMPNLEEVTRVYTDMSNRLYTHASPTMFNAGTRYPQMSSCFLLSMEDDLSKMLDSIKYGGLISKFSGGIGINVSMVRSKGSRIFSTGGRSDGLVPYLKVWDSLARYVNQSGKRKGSVAVYLEPHHPDLLDFLKIRRNNTKQEFQCLDLNVALWVSDLFMKRLSDAIAAGVDGISLKDDDTTMWSFFDPNKIIGLHDIYGDEYTARYLQAERDKLYVKQMRIIDVWKEIISTQMETGEPYILFKDHINRRSNQMNIGPIRGSNLCSEITQYTDSDTIAVCNLCSISLPAFVRDGWNESYLVLIFDFDALGRIAEDLTESMNNIIDRNHYPVPQAEKSNFETRAIGIGAQGLADVFQMLNLSWSSSEAKQLNLEIYATIHYHCLKKSCELARRDGPYLYFKGSPASKGLLQPHLAGLTEQQIDAATCGRLDWKKLANDIQEHGLRNSLLTTQMPTASTAQILGNNESMEPYTTNLYVRRVLSGDFPVINQHLYRRLCSLGLWTPNLVNEIISRNGSILGIPGIPDDVRAVFRTAWEMRMKWLVDMAVDRGAFIDQSQSFNVFIEKPTINALTSMLIYAWKEGMKTGMYYLRRRPKVDAVKFSLPPPVMRIEEEIAAQAQENSVGNNNSSERGVVVVEMKADDTASDFSDSEEDVVLQVCRKQQGCTSCGG